MTIGNTLIQGATERGVLVDYQGYFLGAFQWAVGKKPQFQKKPPKSPKEILHLLTEPEALDPPSELGRWDFQAKVWELPTQKFYVVDSVGRLRGGRARWPDRLPALPPGFDYVTAEPPRLPGEKALWDAESQEWKFPRRVAILDADDFVINIEQENPRNDQPNVVVPEGGSRIDEDSEPFPVDTEGKKLSPGMLRDGAVFHDFDFSVTKARLTLIIDNQGYTTQFADYLASIGPNAQTVWDELSPDRRIPIRNRYIIGFLRHLGVTKAQIINFVRNQLKE